MSNTNRIAELVLFIALSLAAAACATTHPARKTQPKAHAVFAINGGPLTACAVRKIPTAPTDIHCKEGAKWTNDSRLHISEPRFGPDDPANNIPFNPHFELTCTIVY